VASGPLVVTNARGSIGMAEDQRVGLGLGCPRHEKVVPSAVVIPTRSQCQTPDPNQDGEMSDTGPIRPIVEYSSLGGSGRQDSFRKGAPEKSIRKLRVCGDFERRIPLRDRPRHTADPDGAARVERRDTGSHFRVERVVEQAGPLAAMVVWYFSRWHAPGRPWGAASMSGTATAVERV